MGRSYFLLSILLLACMGFLGFRLYGVLTTPFVFPLKAEAPKASAAKGEVKVETASQPKEKDPMLMLAIVQKDLFRPSRTEPKKEELSKVQPPQTPPPRLVGTLVTESRTEAFLEDAVTKAVKPYHVKETIGEFTVVDIKDNRVALRRGNEQVTIDIPLAGPNPLGVGSVTPRAAQPVTSAPPPAAAGGQGISQVPPGATVPPPKVAPPGPASSGQGGQFGPLGNRTRRPSEPPRRPTINQGAGQ
jgi:hypothetical protein